MNQPKGSHWVLARINVLATIIILHFFTIDVNHIGRERFEGLAYNVAWSSEYGDKALIAVIALSALILQRPGHLPGWLTGGTYHIVCGMLAIAVGILLVSINPYTRQQIMDNYHNFFVVGLFLYLLATTVPVIYWGGTTAEKYVAVCLLVFWAVLVVCDFKTGRIDQRQWLQTQGTVFPK